MGRGRRPHRVAIIEDHLLQRRRTEELIRSAPDLEVVFSGESVPILRSWLRQAPREHKPDLLLLDLVVERQPSVDVSFVRAMLRSGVRIVVLSALTSPPLVREVVRAGVDGVVGKRDSEADILEAVRSALRGREWMTTELAAVIAADPTRPRLSTQEERALILYASGLTLDAVAASMNVQRDTAKQYLDRVRSKYTAIGVAARSKHDLTRIAWLDGYSDPQEAAMRGRAMSQGER